MSESSFTQSATSTCSLQRSFFQDPTLAPKLFNLLDIVFPGFEIGAAAEQASKLGARWEDVSTPFARIHDGTLITHVGVLEIPMRLMGEDVTVGGIHAVCTHPEYRRRGYYREVMNQVLDYCDSRYDTLLLTTAQPELYQPFGFRVVQEHSFYAECGYAGGINGLRLVDTGNGDDIQLLNRLLETREPISNIAGVFNQKALFLVNEGTRPLYYIEKLQAIACLEIKDNHLKLFDLVTPRLFPLESLLEHLPHPIDSVTIYFSPDRLQIETQAVAEIFEGDSLLMVRGRFSCEHQKFTLPRSARC